jgi:hypothetical protein
MPRLSLRVRDLVIEQMKYTIAKLKHERFATEGVGWTGPTPPNVGESGGAIIISSKRSCGHLDFRW